MLITFDVIDASVVIFLCHCRHTHPAACRRIASTRHCAIVFAR
jgi:hypothetical protein